MYFNLSQPVDYQAYLDFNPSFNATNDCLTEQVDSIKYIGDALTHYQLELTPDSFFIFGSGYGDDAVDNKPITEDVLKYDDHEIKFVTHSLIPASSIKGAISHRTCFHYNKHETIKAYADEIKPDDHERYVGKNNYAVYILFGMGAGEDDKSPDIKKKPSRGRIIIDDLYYSNEQINNEKIINHVAIDRFTGGAIAGALFSEKVSQWKEEKPILLNIWVEKGKFDNKNTTENTIVHEALEAALQDICKGLLPLGGMTTKGHGVFTGKLIKHEDQPKILFDYEKNI